MMKKIITIILSVALMSCAGMSEVNTPSGKPEITIAGAAKKDVIDLLTAKMVAINYHPKSVSDYVATFETATSTTDSILQGLAGGTAPIRRVTYSIVDAAGSVKVAATVLYITNPNSFKEQTFNHSYGKPGKEIQTLLESIGASLRPSK